MLYVSTWARREPTVRPDDLVGTVVPSADEPESLIKSISTSKNAKSIHRVTSPRPRPAFSLIELVIVILILAVLVAVAAPRFYSVADEAKMNSVVSEAKKLNQLAVVTQQLTGEWPATQPPGVVPPELIAFFPSAKFPSPPVAGNWQWVGPVSGKSEFGMAISVHPKREETALFELAEKTFDNGALDSGWIIQDQSGSNNIWLFSIK